MGESTFWFTLVLSIVILMIPVVAWRFYFVDVHPTLSDRVRLKQRLSAIRCVDLLVDCVVLLYWSTDLLNYLMWLRAHKSQDFLRTPSARRSRRSLRSGYAFAHQEGFGKLITSGKIMRKTGLNFGKASSNNAANNNSGSSHNVSTGGPGSGVASGSDQADGIKYLAKNSNKMIDDCIVHAIIGPVSAISYHPTGESNGSMQPGTRQSQNGSGVQSRVPTVAYARTASTYSRPRLQDPYAITVDPESAGDSALPNSLSSS